MKPDKIKTDSWGSTAYYLRKVNITCRTNGEGLWSNSKRKIIHQIEIVSELPDRITYRWESDCSNLRVYFNKKYWDIEKHGLIYTDELWLKSFLEEIKRIGFKNFKKVQYSEQGMQGNNYVDLDIDKNFKKEFFNILYTKKEKLLKSFT